MKRGIRCSVEVAETAEHDLVIHKVSEDTLRRIAADIVSAPHRDLDQHVGTVRIRSLAGLDVVFALYPSGGGLIATIFNVRPSKSSNPTQLILESLGWLATIRGALGL